MVMAPVEYATLLLPNSDAPMAVAGLLGTTSQQVKKSKQFVEEGPVVLADKSFEVLEY